MTKRKQERKETARKRNSIIERDNTECQVCGCNHLSLLEVHHIFPIYLGGTSEDDNLITLCDQCHFIAPHVASQLGTTREVFHEIFKEFQFIIQSKQRAKFIKKIVLEWNEPDTFGWGDIRDINSTCKRIIDNIKEHRVIEHEPETIDIDRAVSMLIREFSHNY